MPFPLLLGLVALLSFVALGALRIVRVRFHRGGLTGWWRVLFVLLFLIVPPVVAQILFAPKTGATAVDPLGAVLLYIPAVVAIWLITLALALVVAKIAPVRWRPVLLLALIGRDTSGAVAFDPPMTAELIEDVDRVDVANQAFPRGSSFIGQTTKPGFRSSWDTLDAATHTLEERIDEQNRLHLGVAERAIHTAADARGRLDTLKRDALAGDQAWAS